MHLGVPSPMKVLSGGGLFLAHVVLLNDHGLLWVNRLLITHACLHPQSNKSIQYLGLAAGVS